MYTSVLALFTINTTVLQLFYSLSIVSDLLFFTTIECLSIDSQLDNVVVTIICSTKIKQRKSAIEKNSIIMQSVYIKGPGFQKNRYSYIQSVHRSGPSFENIEPSL